MEKLLDFLFNRWGKWELVAENVPYIKTVLETQFHGEIGITPKSVIVDIYQKKHKKTNKVKRKIVEKRVYRKF